MALINSSNFSILNKIQAVVEPIIQFLNVTNQKHQFTVIVRFGAKLLLILVNNARVPQRLLMVLGFSATCNYTML